MSENTGRMKQMLSAPGFIEASYLELLAQVST